MKKMTAVLLIAAAMATIVCAAGPNELNDGNIKVFIKMFPKYLELSEKYRDSLTGEDGSSKTVAYKREVGALCRRYKISADEFAVLVRKITYAVSAVKMKQNDVPVAWLDDPSFVSQKEMVSVERYMPQLEKIFE